MGSKFLGMIENHRFLPKTSQGSTSYLNKIMPENFLRYALHAGGVWKGDILVADVDVLEFKGMTGVPDPEACWTDPRSLCGAQGRIPR